MWLVSSLHERSNYIISCSANGTAMNKFFFPIPLRIIWILRVATIPQIKIISSLLHPPQMMMPTVHMQKSSCAKFKLHTGSWHTCRKFYYFHMPFKSCKRMWDPEKVFFLPKQQMFSQVILLQRWRRCRRHPRAREAMLGIIYGQSAFV